MCANFKLTYVLLFFPICAQLYVCAFCMCVYDRPYECVCVFNKYIGHGRELIQEDEKGEGRGKAG